MGAEGHCMDEFNAHISRLEYLHRVQRSVGKEDVEFQWPSALHQSGRHGRHCSWEWVDYFGSTGSWTFDGTLEQRGHSSYQVVIRRKKERCSGSFRLAVGFLVKDDSISERLG